MENENCVELKNSCQQTPEDDNHRSKLVETMLLSAQILNETLKYYPFQC